MALRLPNIGLLGRAGAGKDTVAEILGREYGYRRVAFADPLKTLALAVDPIVHTYADGSGLGVVEYRLSELVDLYGWDEAKRDFPEVRRFLQRLGLEGVRHVIGDNTWIYLAEAEIARARRDRVPVVVTDVRFPNEVEMLKRWGFELVWVVRPGARDGDHPSENAVGPEDADLILGNDGPLSTLRDRVASLVELVTE